MMLIPLKVEIAPREDDPFVPVQKPIEEIIARPNQEWQAVFTALDSETMHITTCHMRSMFVVQPLEAAMWVTARQFGVMSNEQIYLRELRDELNRILGDDK
jgi:hypothetical protein